MNCIWQLMLVLSIYFCIGTAQKVEFTDVTDDIKDNIYIILFEGPKYNDSVRLKLEDGLTFTDYNFFNESRGTVYYFHGWGESADIGSVVTVVEAFLDVDIVNIAAFDYSVLVENANNLEYLQSVINASYISEAIAQYLQQYTTLVQPIDLLHLISHSLGSQVMSKTAKHYGKGLLPWLTALDPAGPIFDFPGVQHLEASDGRFVEAIHTDGSFFGDYRSLVASVNFFPNRGTRPQPFCHDKDEAFCSHKMSWIYYAESIRKPTGFPALRCYRSVSCDIALGLCNCEYNREVNYIGLLVNKSLCGDFYLSTNAQPPFERGLLGLNFTILQ